MLGFRDRPVADSASGTGLMGISNADLIPSCSSRLRCATPFQQNRSRGLGATTTFLKPLVSVCASNPPMENTLAWATNTTARISDRHVRGVSRAGRNKGGSAWGTATADDPVLAAPEFAGSPLRASHSPESVFVGIPDQEHGKRQQSEAGGGPNPVHPA